MGIFAASHSLRSQLIFKRESSIMAPLLGYWNVRGLTSSIRNLLRYKEAEFEETLYEFSDEERQVWLADKSSLDLDFPNLPYYIDGDVKLTQVRFIS